jgi:hypothetical protein
MSGDRREECLENAADTTRENQNDVQRENKSLPRRSWNLLFQELVTGAADKVETPVKPR